MATLSPSQATSELEVDTFQVALDCLKGWLSLPLSRRRLFNFEQFAEAIRLKPLHGDEGERDIYEKLMTLDLTHPNESTIQDCVQILQRRTFELREPDLRKALKTFLQDYTCRELDNMSTTWLADTTEQLQQMVEMAYQVIDDKNIATLSMDYVHTEPLAFVDGFYLTIESLSVHKFILVNISCGLGAIREVALARQTDKVSRLIRALEVFLERMEFTLRGMKQYWTATRILVLPKETMERYVKAVKYFNMSHIVQ